MARWPAPLLLSSLLLWAAPAPAGGPDAGQQAPDAGQEAPGVEAAADPCALFAARMARRRGWLAARRQEQFERGGPPDPSLGILNAVALWCAAHPDDEECALGSVAIEVRPEELAWSPERSPDDFDAHLILMRRQLAECRARAARRW